MITEKFSLFFLSFVCSLNAIQSYIVEPGPLVIATKGEVWPKPQQQTFYDEFLILRPQFFEFKVEHESCDILQQALKRYENIINSTLPSHYRSRNKGIYRRQYQPPKPWRLNGEFKGYITSLRVLLVEPCTNIGVPDYTMDEKYILNITENDNLLSATSLWGILRGLETFSQLLHPARDQGLQINLTTIYDYPRFSHRGLLVDTSRHFIPMAKLYKILDAMSYNKLNVFHWHITDDQSFPYVSQKFPKLSEMGAFTDTQVYSNSDVQKIINHAAARGIRVLAEFDTPGHTRSWGEAMPQLLTPCYNNEVPSGQYGPMDPTKDFVYSFLTDFFDEVIKVFPDQYIHLGADEVEFECWESNPNIKQYMQDNNITSYRDLEDVYIKKLLTIVDNLNAKSIVWEEVFTNGITLPKNTIVHVWKDNWKPTLYMATRAGLPALLSGGWYLDHLAWGGDWYKFYNNEPFDFPGSDEQKSRILGGETCMWSESVNEYNIESRIWPRASAAAEKLWSAYDADTANNAARRLEEHTCRMNARDIHAQPPNGPGFCL